MALVPGTRLGVYEVTAMIGEGGMGQVYRATDTKLKRPVALKILPSSVAGDLERLARFQREAEVLASLSHPNIAGVYGLEESPSTGSGQAAMTALVMEFVDGDDLAQRLARGPIPIDDALPIAKQIVDALEAAHEQGIVHRDLKPANIKVRPDGTVKVLDFGLAKALGPEAAGAAVGSNSMSPTITSPAMMTKAGMILGTAAYMAPEQARGRAVDKRADIWAFGAVLFEMLTGRRAFEGEDITDTIVSVMSKEPDWSALPPATHASVRSLLRRCLDKDPKRRLRDVGDARVDLDDSRDPATPGAVPSTPVAPPASWPRRAAGLLVLAVAVAVAAGAGRWWERRQAPASVEWRGDLLGGSTVALLPRVSPDGQMLAFQAMVDGQTQVAVMKPQSGNWAILSHDRTHGIVQDMSWSHDGTRIFFDRFEEVPRGVFSVPSLGGDERLILEDAGWPRALADGSLLLVRINAQRVGQLFHYWPDTGRLDALNAFLSVDAGAVLLRVFPDGREAVFNGTVPDSPTAPRLYAIDLTSGRTRPLTTAPGIRPRVTSLAVTPDGQSVLFDVPAGNVRRIVQVPRDGSGAGRTLFTVTAMIFGLDVGPDGSVYVGQAERIADVFSYSPRDGKVERRALPETAFQSSMLLPLPDGRILFRLTSAGRFQIAALAPGKDAVPFLDTEEPTREPMALVGKDRVAFLIGTDSSRRIAIASLVDGRILRRLDRPDAATVTALAASPDGKLLYYVDAGSVWSMPSEGGEPKKVHEGDQVAVDPTDLSLIIQVTTRDAVKLVRLPAGGGPERVIPVSSRDRLFAELAPSAVAPDGRIAIRLVPKDSWFWPAAILDPRSGVITQLPGGRDLDMLRPAWTADGRLVSLALPMRSSIWRFRPVPTP